MEDDGSCIWTLEQGKLAYPQENPQLLDELQEAQQEKSKVVKVRKTLVKHLLMP